MAGKLILITGGAGGIGFEAAKQMIGKGHSIVLAVRGAERAAVAVRALKQHAAAASPKSASITVDAVQCDLASLDSVRSCAKEVLTRFPKLDVLLCNAGVVQQRFGRSADGHELTFATNHLAHFLLVHLLMPALQRSEAARVVLVSSEMHRYLSGIPAQPDYFMQLDAAGAGAAPGMKLYSLSKLYNLWFTFALAKLLPPNVVANAVTPGFVPATDLSRGSSSLGQWFMRNVMSWAPFAVRLEEGARRVSAVCIGDAEGRESGKYYSAGLQKAASPDSYDTAKAERLWSLSMEATKVKQFMP